jgi:hypothetical protein
MDASPLPSITRPSVPGSGLGFKLLLAVCALLGGGLLTAVSVIAAVPGLVLPLLVHHLPGFDIGLPPGSAHHRAGFSYARGGLEVRAHSLFGIEQRVVWEPGAPVEAEEVDRIVESTVAGFRGQVRDIQKDVSVTAPAGWSARSWGMGLNDGESLWVTHLACGGRRIVLYSSGRGGSLERLHRRVVATMRCRPDPAKEAALGDMPVVMGVPPGWSRLKTGKDQLMISDGHFRMFAQASSGKLDDADHARLLPILFGTQLKIGERVGKEWPLSGAIQGAPVTGWVTTRYCALLDQSLTVLATCQGDQRQAELARQLVRGVRCRRPDERPEEWPTPR